MAEVEETKKETKKPPIVEADEYHFESMRAGELPESVVKALKKSSS